MCFDDLRVQVLTRPTITVKCTEALLKLHLHLGHCHFLRLKALEAQPRHMDNKARVLTSYKTKTPVLRANCRTTTKTNVPERNQALKYDTDDGDS